MADYKTIEIDFEVHRVIEGERRGFSEPENAALRRLLKLPEKTEQKLAKAPPKGRPWMGKSVTLPHGTEVRMEYNGRVHSGEILDGEWVVEGSKFKSPSAAAGGVARTRDGGKPSLDGWTYWHAKRPGDMKWSAISTLRAVESVEW